MQFNWNLIKLWAFVVAFGVALLLLTYLAPVFLVLIGLIVAGVLVYLIYKAGKASGLF